VYLFAFPEGIPKPERMKGLASPSNPMSKLLAFLGKKKQ
jgi:hypothetical protein